MAQHKSAKTRIRRNERRRAINRLRVSRIRTCLRRVEEAIAGGDKEAAAAVFRAMQPELQRGVNKGILHRNTAARKLSRLNARIKAM